MSGIGFTRGMTGRADLIRARRLKDPDLEEFLAEILGYRLVAPEPPAPIEPPEATIDDATRPALAPTTPSVARNIPFWQATRFVLNPTRPAVIPTPPKKPTHRRERKAVDLSFLALTSNASLITRLRGSSPTRAVSGEIDIDRVVDEWGKGRFLASVPRSMRKSWGRSVQVFVDRSRRLIPYWEDQTRAYQAIRDVYPPDECSCVVLPEGSFDPASMKIGRQIFEYLSPAPGSAVVALSDLGALAPGGTGLISLWAERGRRLRDLGVKPLAFVPYRRAACPPELTRYWSILPWEASADADAPALRVKETEILVQQILTLLSFTLRIEPQLIRFARRLLSAGRGDPGIESRVWQNKVLGEPHCNAAELSRNEADLLRAALPSQNRSLRELIYDRVAATHHKIYKGVWYAEMANLGPDDLIDDDERRGMCDWFESQARSLESNAESGDIGPVLAWHREVSRRLLSVPYQDRGRLGRVLHRIWSIVHRDDPDPALPDGADLSLLPPETERWIELRQFGDRLIASYIFDDGSLRDGSPLALLRTFQSRLKIEPLDDFWEGGVAPAWADGWGRDDFGPWVDLRVKGAKQRLRWIPADKFWMGSPDDEEGRYPDEGPRHVETIASGFWMFDTPCTQALWEAVMGEKPSEFKGPDRPVENVSWDQCQEFIKRLNDRCEGLGLALPTEAQWEYACRAGTDTPRYREDLNEIAWYGENSQGETHIVRQKAPNDWGIYDALGNVFEWCDDVWTDNYNTKKTATASAHRVFRGGSWIYDALSVRAAYRDRSEPSYRINYLGFRCAEFRAPGLVGRERGAERAWERGGAGAEHPGDRDQASGAGWINLDAPGLDGVSFAGLAPVRVSSDVEQVVLRTTTLPGWASAIGRDKYGLWAEFVIEQKVAKPPTKRAAKIKLRILILYPDAGGLALLTSMLKSLGHNIEEATNDRMAVRLMERNNVDLVLAGVDPLDAEALELLTYVSRKHREVPVILLFPRLHPERAEEALRISGATAVLKYPVPAAELRAVVLQALELLEARPHESPSRNKKIASPPEPRASVVRQRLRWIPPGRFLMGSPRDEEGRYAWEQDPREFTIDEGFWMFGTPCTQVLWEALMGENPSQFKSPNRPVETVSWEKCQEFLTALNSRVDGLHLSLPSEAQWEYACRAGTTTATYAGPMEIKGANNAPILHEIAWYGGNSGIGFELSNGVDTSDWREKEFEFDKAGTHPVAKKRANPWGLYDMLGNVWEWCEDVWESGGTEKSEPSAHRVIRGGSWHDGALIVRAAIRRHYVPSYRYNALGFRCAEFRQGIVSGARQASAAEGAEQPGDRDPTSAAARLGEDEGLSAQPN